MLSKEVVEKVATLARLKLSEEELIASREVLSAVLANFEQIAIVDTEGVRPLVTPTDMPMMLREDEVGRAAGSDQLLANAPEKSGRLFKVPPVV